MTPYHQSDHLEKKNQQTYYTEKERNPTQMFNFMKRGKMKD